MCLRVLISGPRYRPPLRNRSASRVQYPAKTAAGPMGIHLRALIHLPASAFAAIAQLLNARAFSGLACRKIRERAGQAGQARRGAPLH
eukprot:8807929-Pyramimonas_sp.AAC.1